MSSVGLVWAHFFKISTTQAKQKLVMVVFLANQKEIQTTKVETTIGLKG